MTYNPWQQNKVLAESSLLSRNLLLREGILDTLKKISKKYYGSDDPFNVMVTAARASRAGNIRRVETAKKELDNEINLVTKNFHQNQRRLRLSDASHPEILENKFHAERGYPHTHTPVPFTPVVFDKASEFLKIQRDPATHAGGSTDPKIWAMLVNQKAKAHANSQKQAEIAHNTQQAQLVSDRKQEFSDFKKQKIGDHINSIISSDYNHPLTAAHRVFQRDSDLYKLTYRTGPKYEKYRKRGDTLRGLLTYYVDPKDSPTAKFWNLFSHNARMGVGKKDELSAPGVSEPYSSGDSEHGPR